MRRIIHMRALAFRSPRQQSLPHFVGSQDGGGELACQTRELSEGVGGV